MKLYKIGSVAFIVLGALHLVAHFAGNANPSSEILAVLRQMKNLKIELLGTHDFLKFHNGFSIMMGFLLSVFGFQNLMIADVVTKKLLISSIVITIILLLLSMLYFHLLATAFFAISLICYLIFYKQIS
ncbi:hypothetical protein SAMN05421780_10569 [Flexibacter flexilis DSM 6793]|uniref:Uncharacterized protein n=1 Tax=Flexibacter flexilis DSM 6793 TaxID=927664 RepID=A0A1I1IRP2_9BACT|nr:hypothetical protein [Flexibacter flexilis]SFC38904.1 hypothetical protein SAMN05421780_10569 [Flexibacter flexilis DSM 6793]